MISLYKKKRKLGHKHIQGDHMKTVVEDSHLQDREASEETNPADTLI